MELHPEQTRGSKMATYHEIVRHVLADGKISNEEVKLLCDHVYRTGTPNLDDVRLLVELYTGAPTLSEAFENFFYGVLKKVILADGEILPGEQFYLLKTIYSDRVIRPRELAFLRELRTEAKQITPAFEQLCQTAFESPATNWSVGGTPAFGTSA
jgi:hypothetical protein